ncbi:hypothetical protein C8R45DRAFT_1091005 [Mycena sanguinolenta]|nr:hypothetical protein C8R45DRAFT_1091005 [Mycena sanguinolenta]
MADIVGLVASGLQLIDTLSKARDYIQDFHNAPKHQQELLIEITHLRSLLQNVEDRISCAGQGGRLKELKEPLTRLNAIMEQLVRNLNPNGIVKLSSRLVWPLWGKRDVDEALGTIERLKTLLNAWLAMDVSDTAQGKLAGHINGLY